MNFFIHFFLLAFLGVSANGLSTEALETLEEDAPVLAQLVQALETDDDDDDDEADFDDDDDEDEEDEDEDDIDEDDLNEDDEDEDDDFAAQFLQAVNDASANTKTRPVITGSIAAALAAKYLAAKVAAGGGTALATKIAGGGLASIAGGNTLVAAHDNIKRFAGGRRRRRWR